ncbi:MAG: hypothetical protein P1V51_16160 [Deltaproteobacteria bacterium]|nr:hypothetical protein [Deltaproteobacteria bacterium]
MKTARLALAALLLSSTACFPAADDDATPPAVGRYSAETQSGLLAFLNDQVETDQRRLDVDCGLRADTAENLIRHRDGLDGLVGTEDDDLYESVDEVDAVGGVGPASLEKLLQCAEWFAPTEPVVDRVDVFTELAQVDPALAGLITGELQAEAERRADPSRDAPVVFEAVTVHSAGGKAVRIEVDYLQGELRIRLVLDGEYQLVTDDVLG